MLSKFAKLIFNYGSFAKPFLNIALDSNTDEIWRLYFIAIKLEWKRNHFLALRKVEKGLAKLKRKNMKKRNFFSSPARYEKGKNIFYLLYVLKLMILKKGCVKSLL